MKRSYEKAPPILLSFQTVATGLMPLSRRQRRHRGARRRKRRRVPQAPDLRAVLREAAGVVRVEAEELLGGAPRTAEERPRRHRPRHRARQSEE